MFRAARFHHHSDVRVLMYLQKVDTSLVFVCKQESENCPTRKEQAYVQMRQSIPLVFPLLEA